MPPDPPKLWSTLLLTPHMLP